MAINTLFLTLETFSQTGGIQKVCRSMAKVLMDGKSPEDTHKTLRMFSLCDKCDDVDERYIPRQYFKGFSYRKAFFGVVATWHAFRSKKIILSHVHLLPVVVLVKLLTPRKRVIMLAHGTEVWRELRGWKKVFLQNHVEIWAVSNYTKKMLEEKHSIAPERIKILHNCLDPFIEIPLEFNKPMLLLERYGLQPEQPVLLSITRLNSHELYKGYDLVIRSMPELLKKYPGMKYLIGGKADDKEYSRIKALIAEMEVEEQVLMIGFIPDEELTDHFLLADIFLLPSRKEGFGIVFVEAAARQASVGRCRQGCR
ncbi:MAG: glycosyltransferase, partial [Chryseobacterium sp.]